MSFIVTVTPQQQFTPGEKLNIDTLNLLGQPTVAVTGSSSDLGDVATVTAVSKTFTVASTVLDTLTCTAHGLSQPATAQAAQRVYLTTSATLPEGLLTSTTYSYFARVLDANTLTLHSTPQGAVDGTNRVDITDSGSGVQTLHYSIFATGTPLIFDVSAGKWKPGIASLANLPDMIGAAGSLPGARGAVPQPQVGDAANFLKGDGSWGQPPTPVSIVMFNYLNFA